MVVSPQNPLKQKSTLANDYDRLHLVNLAIGDNPKLKASNIEFNLPIPSYTVDTLAYLAEKYEKYTFSLIMGGDNLSTIHKWKNYTLLLERYSIILYNRPDHIVHADILNNYRIHTLDAPLLSISSTYIRNALKDGKSIRYLVPEDVYKYLHDYNMYK